MSGQKKIFLDNQLF